MVMGREAVVRGREAVVRGSGSNTTTRMDV